MSKKKVVVIGTGFAGLSAACCLAKAGFDVTVLEKNAGPGGRARQFQAQGFTFDMGPSWYWMPDVFEAFFALFGKKVSDYYALKRLDPSYSIWYGTDDRVDIPANMVELEAVFERYEPGSTPKLRKFLAEAEYKYQVGINEFVYKPSQSIWEFADWRILMSLFRLHMFSSVSKQVRGLFSHPKLIQLLEFPVLFLGATPQKTPGLYSMMNYADMALGTWYPMGGMYEIVRAMTDLAEELGVKIVCDCEVSHIDVENGQAKRIRTLHGTTYEADIVVGGADYHHIDSVLLDAPYRNYSAAYWEKRTLAPSSLLYYLGVNKRLQNLEHHNLFFDADFGRHAKEIYDHPKWPEKPLFYVSAPSVTDPTVAPAGHENLFLLIPVAPGLSDTPEIREHYFQMTLQRLEHLTKQSIRENIVFRRDFAHADFVKDYHSLKGNAYGLANTLLQTAFLKPKLRNRHVKNLYYTGQLTVPGPGVPPSLISGQVVAKLINEVHA